MPELFLDFESRGPDLKKLGTYAYADRARAIVAAWAIDDGPVNVMADHTGLEFEILPDFLRHAIEDPDTIVIAWNAGFDRAIWNFSIPDLPYLAPERTRDAMAQAMASNLPPGLDDAAHRLGLEGKQDDGKALISLFCPEEGADPKDYPDEWLRFQTYAGQDITSLREVWRRTIPLSETDWRVYAANEAVNERGIAFDRPLCERAAKLADDEGARIGARLRELTHGTVTTVNQSKRIARWVYDRLPDSTSREILTTSGAEPEEGDDIRETTITLSMARDLVERLRDYLDDIKCQDVALMEVLELREFGASAAPKKFSRILAQANSDDRLRGQLVFNGAGQTGRFSSKGAQLHNTTRQALGGDYGDHEVPAIEAILDGCDLSTLAAIGDGEAPARKLSLLVRPAFIAPPRKTLIKADYAQVEARVLPWLAGSNAAGERLAYFDAVDHDPTLPDLYTISASGMLSKEPAAVSKAERQSGKVSELACGFGGGRGALQAMAANYRLYISSEEAQRLVELWRAANPWAPAFWGKHTASESYGLWGAAVEAYHHPGLTTTAGKIHFLYESRYLGGTLIMLLPSGRRLFYPWCKWRKVAIKDKHTKQIIEEKEGLSFLRAGGVKLMWHGLLAENATQAAAADLLRESLIDCDVHGLEVVLHTHDELVIEVFEEQAAGAESVLEELMTRDRVWNRGLPLKVDSVPRWYYSASQVRHAA